VPDDTLDLSWTLSGTVAHLDSLKSSAATWTFYLSAQTPNSTLGGLNNYSLLGVKSVSIADRTNVSPGAVGSTSAVVLGTDDTTGDIESGGSVSMSDRTLVRGSVVYGSTITEGNNVVITGTATRGTVSIPTLSTPTCTPGTVDKNITTGTVALAPGAYHNVTVSSGATLTLTPGTYQLLSLVVQAGGNIKATATGTGVNVLAKGSINIGDRSVVSLTTGSVASNMHWTYLGTGTFQVATNVTMSGWLSAPLGTIDVASQSRINGAIQAQAVILEPQAYGVYVGVADLPPVLSGAPIDTGSVSVQWKFQAVATDPQGSTLTWKLMRAPTGAAVSTAGLVTWTPTSAQTAEFDLSACDSLGVCAELGWNVQANTALPVITSTPPTTGKEALAYSYTVTATDVNGYTLHYRAGTLPTGMTFDTTAHKFAWTPTLTQAGSYALSVQVSDGHADTAKQSWTLVVADSNTPPVITSTAPTTGKEAIVYSYTVTATDANGYSLHYLAGAAPLPTGMTFDTTAHKFAWTPSFTQAGSYPLWVKVSDGHGDTTKQSWTLVVADSNTPPVITSTPGTTGKEGVAYSYTVTATDANGYTLHYLAGTLPTGMTFDTTAHKFAWTPSFTQGGSYSLFVKVSDGHADTTKQSWTLVVADSNVLPVITSTPPITGKESVAYSYTVTATDANGYTLHYAAGTLPSGMTFDTTADKFSWTPSFTQGGSYPLTAMVSNGVGQVATQSWTLVVADSNVAPVITSIAPTTDKEGAIYTYTVAATDANGYTLHYTTSTLPSGMTFDTTADKFTWTPSFTQAGSYPISITASNGFGESATQTWTLAVADSTVPPPPDTIPPSPVAPPLPVGGVPPFLSQVSFLWTGSQPTIFGVITDSLDTARVAVLRGRVIGVDNAPIPGVRVQVADHPEFGHTFTRADGRYELVANGGVSVWADFGKSGYLPLQRLSRPYWKQYAGMLDVVLTKLDATTTVVSSGSTQAQLVKSTPQTELDGTRMLSMYIPAGTHATFQMPDSSIIAAPQLTLRTTEYTVGQSGPLAMPSDLPAITAYTYAFDVTADEELAAGAVHILFDHPVAMHLDNFLHFPVGATMPYGVLNRITHRWEAVPSGRVVQVLSVSNGQAVLDVSGSGFAAPADTLAALGIDTAELRIIASRFSVGSTLWRVQGSRFSGGDWNCDYPIGAVAPNLDTGSAPVQQPPQGDCTRPGCVLELEQQRLGEDFPVPGTGLSVHYRSDRSPKHVEDYRVQFRLSPPVKVTGFLGGIARLWVAGQEIDDSINKTDSVQIITLPWNGLDAWGRQINGSVQGQLAVNYNWAITYAPAQLFAGAISSGGSGSGGSGAVAMPSIQRADVVLPTSTTHTVTLGRVYTPGLGLQGWSIDGVQSLDRIAGVLVGGDGNDRLARPMGAGVGNLGITDTNTFIEPRTGKRLSLIIPEPTVETDGAGNVYFTAEVNLQGAQMLLRRSLTGTISIVAGSTFGPYPYENAPSDSIASGNPNFHVTRDGIVYFTDPTPGVRVIWRRDLDGRIHRVFGGGSSYMRNDPSILGMPGTNLLLADSGYTNQWVITSFAQDGDGRVHVLAQHNLYDSWRFILSPSGNLESAHLAQLDGLGYEAMVGRDANDRALYIGVNGSSIGYVYTFGGCNTLAIYDGDTANLTWQAGSIRGFNDPTPPAYQDGASSSTGYLGVLGETKSISAAPDGTTYVLSPGSLISVGSDSAVHHVAGVFQTNGGLSSNPQLVDLSSTYSMALLPNGVIVLGGLGGNGIATFRTLDPTAVSMTQVPSKDGSQIYVFDTWAHHTLTLDALTGDTIRRMNYDSSGRVTQITDGYGNQTALTYTGTGITIKAPGGQQTVLNLAGNQVTSVTGPDSHSDLLAWQNGFLASHTDPLGRTSQYGFDTLGNLAYDQRPDGKQVTLSSTFDLATQTRFAEIIQPSGRALQATTSFLPDLSANTVIVGEQGDTTVVHDWATGDTRVVSSDHTITHVTALQHPQFGTLVPLPGVTADTTPDGIISQTTYKVGITQGSVPPYGPPRTWHDTSVTPSGTWLRAWDSLSRTWTLTDPQGRISSVFVGKFGVVDSVQLPGLPTVSYTRDSRGRISTIRQGGRVWRTVWGPANTMDSLVDPLGREIALHWDASLRSLGGTTPDGRVIALTRWADGSLASLTPPGRKAHQFFTNSLGDDSLYLPPSIDSTGGGSLLWNWTQDRTLSGMTTPVGNIGLGRDALGRVVSVSEATDTTHLSYDSLGRVDSLLRSGQRLAWTWDGSLPLSETWSGAVTGSVSTTWDANFHPTSQTAAGSATSYGYDPDGTLTHAGVLSVSRDPVSGLTSGDTVGSIIHRLGRDGQGEIIADSTTYQGTTILAISTFTRDSLGRILTKGDWMNGTNTNWKYKYDLAGRLDSVWANGSLSAWYGYDSNGVRISGTGISGVSVDAQDRVTSANGISYAYDENGRMVSRSSVTGTTRYHYTLQGELLSVVLPSGDSVSYTLDAIGRRIARKLNGVATNRWLWEGSLRPVAEVDSIGNILTRYVYGTHVNVPDYMVRAGVTYQLVTDQLGSLREVVNTSTGAVVSGLNYDVWGNVTSSTNASFQPFGFAGGLRDDVTGLTHFGAREYTPELGRWTRKDPIRFNGRLANLYGYVGNDPVNWIDNNGLVWTYSQSSQQLSHTDGSGNTTNEGSGYSGNGDGLNNPAMQGVQNVGPIPQGKYTINPQQNNVTGNGTSLPNSMTLTPDPSNNMFGRGGVLIHGDNSNGDNSASEGCIILNRSIRNKIANSGDNSLNVTQ
jgi:RHS repeat-associated protein